MVKRYGCAGILLFAIGLFPLMAQDNTVPKEMAIVPGQVLTNEEMTGLVDGLFAVATPNYTPDGKTVLSVINEDDLEKLFK